MSNLSRQDFEGIAKAIRSIQIDWREREKLVDLLSQHFEKRSPRYQRNRFFQACLPRIEQDDKEDAA